VNGNVELARQHWEQAYRQLFGGDGPDEVVLEQIGVVSQELRHRLGGPFTLAELTAVYDASGRWTYEVIAERCGRPGWSRSASAAADAAFHLYAQGARDYQP
jgi:hypothetical protein